MDPLRKLHQSLLDASANSSLERNPPKNTVYVKVKYVEQKAETKTVLDIFLDSNLMFLQESQML